MGPALAEFLTLAVRGLRIDGYITKFQQYFLMRHFSDLFFSLGLSLLQYHNFTLLTNSSEGGHDLKGISKGIWSS